MFEQDTVIVMKRRQDQITKAVFLSSFLKWEKSVLTLLLNIKLLVSGYFLQAFPASGGITFVV